MRERHLESQVKQCWKTSITWIIFSATQCFGSPWFSWGQEHASEGLQIWVTRNVISNLSELSGKFRFFHMQKNRALSKFISNISFPSIFCQYSFLQSEAWIVSWPLAGLGLERNSSSSTRVPPIFKASLLFSPSSSDPFFFSTSCWATPTWWRCSPGGRGGPSSWKLWPPSLSLRSLTSFCLRLSLVSHATYFSCRLWRKQSRFMRLLKSLRTATTPISPVDTFVFLHIYSLCIDAMLFENNVSMYNFQVWTPTLLQYKEDGHNLGLSWTFQPRPRCLALTQRKGKFVQEDGSGG